MFIPGRQLNVTTTLVNSLDPGQAQQNVKPAMNPILKQFFFFNFEKKERKSADDEKQKKNMKIIQHAKIKAKYDIQ